jgi:four helix bundle protein
MKREPAKTFEDLIVWQKAHQLVLEVYKLTAKFPREELFGLTSQMRRAAVSVPANIAEGFKRRGQSDKARVLNIAEGSLEELRYFFILSADLGYGKPGGIADRAAEVGRLLGAYVRTVRGEQEPSS